MSQKDLSSVKKMLAESSKEHFVSLQDLLSKQNQLGDSLGAKCFEHDFKELRNSSSEKNMFAPFHERGKPKPFAANQNFITSLKTMKNPTHNREVTQDTSFSFACLPVPRNKSPSWDKSGQNVVETMSNLNIESRIDDSEQISRQKVRATSGQRRFTQFDKISPQKLVSNQIM